MHLRFAVFVAATAMFLAACTDQSVKGIVSEKHDPRVGYNVSIGKCKTTEWLLVIDQGPRVAKSDRIKHLCVTEETANKYSILATYP